MQHIAKDLCTERNRIEAALKNSEQQLRSHMIQICSLIFSRVLINANFRNTFAVADDIHATGNNNGYT